MRTIMIMLSLLLGVITLSACSEEKKVNEASNIPAVTDIRSIQNLEEAVSYSDLIVIGAVDKGFFTVKRLKYLSILEIRNPVDEGCFHMLQ